MTTPWLPLHRLAGGARVGVLALVALVVVGAPIWVVIVNSLKPYQETVSPSLRLPETWMATENYGVVFAEGELVQGFLNNAIVLGIALPLILVLSAAASWAMVRSSSRLLTPLRYAMLVGLVVPPAIVATIFTLKRIGIYGGLLGLALFYSALFIPLGVFLMIGFIRTIPRHLEEAARIDGASNIDILVRIIIPLLRPALITTTVIVMVAVWNDFLNPFMLLNDPDNNTLILSLFRFATGSTAAASYKWNLVFADVVVTSIPMIAIFYFVQKYMVHGLSGTER
ncbi:MAG: carbohydrate ABC transporter permease [bacterium]|nr:carbohydrate ABC transporter permease [bacterium]